MKYQNEISKSIMKSGESRPAQVWEGHGAELHISRDTSHAILLNEKL